MEAEVTDVNTEGTRKRYTVEVKTNKLVKDPLIINRAKARVLVANGVVNSIKEAIQVVKPLAGEGFMESEGIQKIGGGGGIRGGWGANIYEVSISIDNEERGGLDFGSLNRFESSLKDKTPSRFVSDDDEDEEEDEEEDDSDSRSIGGFSFGGGGAGRGGLGAEEEDVDREDRQFGEQTEGELDTDEALERAQQQREQNQSEDN